MQTYVGDILIAVNPFKPVDLYSDAQSLRYCNVHSKGDFPPHIFAIADMAYNNLMRNGKPQVGTRPSPRTTVRHRCTCITLPTDLDPPPPINLSFTVASHIPCLPQP